MCGCVGWIEIVSESEGPCLPLQNLVQQLIETRQQRKKCVCVCVCVLALVQRFSEKVSLNLKVLISLFFA